VIVLVEGEKKLETTFIERCRLFVCLLVTLSLVLSFFLLRVVLAAVAAAGAAVVDCCSFWGCLSYYLSPHCRLVPFHLDQSTSLPPSLPLPLPPRQPPGVGRVEAIVQGLDLLHALGL